LNATPLLSSALEGIVVLECGDSRAEFAGFLLAALGAEVIRVEGRRGSHSRQVGPFTTSEPNPEHSLTFLRYNLGKKSVVLETGKPAGQDALARLARTADLLIDSGEIGRASCRERV